MEDNYIFYIFVFKKYIGLETSRFNSGTHQNRLRPHRRDRDVLDELGGDVLQRFTLLRTDPIDGKRLAHAQPDGGQETASVERLQPVRAVLHLVRRMFAIGCRNRLSLD